MVAILGNSAQLDSNNEYLDSTFIPPSVTQNGVYSVINIQTADLTASDVTLATLVAPTGKTVMIPLSLIVTVVSKSGAVTVPAVINIGKASSLYGDMFAGVTVPTGLLDSAIAVSSGVLGGVYQDGDTIKMHKTTAITGGPLTIQITIMGYWL